MLSLIMTERWLLRALAVLLVTMGVGPPAAAQNTSLDARLEAVQRQLGSELGRIRTYLTYFDQVNRIAVARRQLTAADGDRRLSDKGKDLYNRHFPDDELATVVAQHGQLFETVLQGMEKAISETKTWPNGGTPAIWQRMARAEIARLRQLYPAWAKGLLDPLPLLETAVKVRGWTQGHWTPPPTLDAFAGQRDRMIGAGEPGRAL